ncbi:hypothetical protein SRCM100623_02510 [Acetobacter pasteurianus]|uniref:Cupin n=2 Tax=Acetobacter pasteurianus TaxID=438 RepID=A0A1Y0Y790_ACEPA|nr:hypothetical protein [Acetobacter pasteurianus]ARW49311.1 hypothetical protein S1001342_03021 [Acetobacter pasteurianus subsp. pasteurianus]OAZ65920.1 hypothetical protein SRCM100623_02510 [Acetobacter pasteurianus]
MKIVKATEFTGKTAWDALDLFRLNGVTARVHWTDTPYIWHENDGPEVFAVLDGSIAMHIRTNNEERVLMLGVGDVFVAEEGDQHRAVPEGVARILVVEKAGSV